MQNPSLENHKSLLPSVNGSNHIEDYSRMFADISKIEISEERYHQSPFAHQGMLKLAISLIDVIIVESKVNKMQKSRFLELNY